MLHAGAPTMSGPVMAPAPPAVNDDEDMWDIVNEIEQEKANGSCSPTKSGARATSGNRCPGRRLRRSVSLGRVV